MKRSLFIFCIVAAAGCQSDSEDLPFTVAPGELSAELTAAERTGEVPASLAPDEDGAEANEAERAGKRAWNNAPKARTEQIDWPAANGYPHVELKLLPESERSKVEALPLPVLLPRDAELLETTIVTTGDDWYAASLKDEGASLHIRGTRVSFDFGDDVWTGEEKLIGDDYTLTRTHQIVSISFAAFGAAYTVDVECSRPMDDVRCTEDDYALDLANELAVAGGLR